MKLFRRPRHRRLRPLPHLRRSYQHHLRAPKHRRRPHRHRHPAPAKAQAQVLPPDRKWTRRKRRAPAFAFMACQQAKAGAFAYAQSVQDTAYATLLLCWQRPFDSRKRAIGIRGLWEEVVRILDGPQERNASFRRVWHGIPSLLTATVASITAHLGAWLT
jgi:hypothetical protein